MTVLGTIVFSKLLETMPSMLEGYVFLSVASLFTSMTLLLDVLRLVLDTRRGIFSCSRLVC